MKSNDYKEMKFNFKNKFDMKNKSSITTKARYFLYTLLAAVVHYFKVRWTAKRFNIWTKELDPKNRERYWLGYDNKIYYGHPMFIFFLSAQNS